jgi:hypothetical protein
MKEIQSFLHSYQFQIDNQNIEKEKFQLQTIEQNFNS